MLKLASPLGTNFRAEPDDIVDTKRALSRLGHYPVPPERGIDDWADTPLFDGIRAFQKANNLKVDGFMRPGGPTETAMNREVHLAANSKNSPPEDGWVYDRDLDVGGDVEIDVNGPVRVDAHNPSVGYNGARYHVDWHGLDERGNVIPEFRNTGKTPEAHPGHLPPFGIKPKVFEPPFPSDNGHRVRIWYPPQSEYSNHPGTPHLKIYKQK